MNFYIHLDNIIPVAIPFYDQPELLIGINLDDEETVEKILRRDDSIFDLLRIFINEKKMLNILKRYSQWDIESIINSYGNIYCYSTRIEDIKCNINDTQTVINDAIDVLNCNWSNKNQIDNAKKIFDIFQKIIEKKKISQLKKDLTKRRRTDFDKNRDSLLLLMIEKNGLKCKTCFSIENITVDHIIPISKGGSDAIENLQLLCRSCNSKKGDR